MSAQLRFEMGLLRPSPELLSDILFYRLIELHIGLHHVLIPSTYCGESLQHTAARLLTSLASASMYGFEIVQRCILAICVFLAGWDLPWWKHEQEEDSERPQRQNHSREGNEFRVLRPGSEHDALTTAS